MRRAFRFLLPPIILLASIGFAASLIATGPETQRQRPQAEKPVVEVLTLWPQNYQVEIPSSGTVTPRTETILTAEISGRIVKISDHFYPGGFFVEGDLLLQLDPQDYQTAVIIARSDVTLKQLALAEEQARSKQARSDWDKMNIGTDPDPLLLRIPQLEHVQADLEAAQARLNQAQIELERTTVIAPYSGRIAQKSVDLGQYLTSGKELARIYASDAVEVRLPVTDEHLRYLSLPEESQNNMKTGRPVQAAVDFTLTRGEQAFHWQGQLVRTEGSVDVESRQLFTIARINNPYQAQDKRPPLKIGQFLRARINGEKLEQVYLIPRGALYDSNTVHIITPDNKLVRRELDVLWRDEQRIIAAGPLQPGERIALTRLTFAAEGVSVQPVDSSTQQKTQDNNNGQQP